MDEHIHDLIPDLLQDRLPPHIQTLTRAHLDICPACRSELADWERLAAAVRAGVSARRLSLPPLSPLVTANLGPGSPRAAHLPGRLRSAWSLIWVQRLALAGTGALPAGLLAVLLGLLGVWLLRDRSAVWIALPFFLLAPLLSSLAAAVLQMLEADQAYEIVSAAPTPPAELLFARLTLALGVLCVLLAAGSLAASVLLAPYGSLRLAWSLIAAWLGPLLLLSALATLLSSIWGTFPACAVCLSLWAAVLLQLVSEMRGRPLLEFSLLPLLEPGWSLLAGQALLAALFWLAAWQALSRGLPPPLTMEGE